MPDAGEQQKGGDDRLDVVVEQELRTIAEGDSQRSRKTGQNEKPENEPGFGRLEETNSGELLRIGQRVDPG